ncbi:MAG: SprT family zinc-dependent metalloprotease [Planctomycetes bacterium]|nr:SprT family zinc-dependent metalloprotease [Planctomycetota bacterium]
MDRLEEMIARTQPPGGVRVEYTRNRRVVISLRKRNEQIEFRVHEIFRCAPREVLEAIARTYFTRTRRDTRRRLNQTVRAYINANEGRIEEMATSARRRPLLYGYRGDVYDLRAIFDELNAEFFGGRLRATLTWSKQINRRKLGTWRGIPGQDGGVIRINRVFDDPSVPRFYIRQLVLHEMLHGVFSNERRNGRIIRHTRAFREFERSSPMYEAAKQWEENHLNTLYQKRIKQQRQRSRMRS